MKLANHPYSNCYVNVLDNGIIQFYSYKTLVIEAYQPHKIVEPPFKAISLCQRFPETFDNEAYFVTCTGTYSQTTRRQISWFLREFFPTLTYYDMKNAAEDVFENGMTCFIAHRK